MGLTELSIPQTRTGLRIRNHQFDTGPPGLHSKPIFPGESGLLAQFSMVTIDASRAVSCSGTARHRDFRQLPFSNVSAVHTDWWCPPFAQHFVRDFLVRGVFKNVYKAEKSRPTK
ncbi:MAG: hypothetical protein KF791_09850 [Verrucomicrobiae bacterium]|nr:hypothetical protein [Verrucomicrobiae bacterium]